MSDRERALTQTSPYQTDPPSESSSSPRTLSSVLLPEPEAPAITARSPASTRRSTALSTGIGADGPRYALRSPSARSIAGSPASPADRVGWREPDDAEGRVGGRGHAEQHREHEPAGQEPRREVEELLAGARGPGVEPETEPESERDAPEPAGERHPERLAEHLAAQLQIGRAQRALDAEVADPLEHRGRDGVGQRQAADRQPEAADANRERGEERGRRAQQPRDLARQ